MRAPVATQIPIRPNECALFPSIHQSTVRLAQKMPVSVICPLRSSCIARSRKSPTQIISPDCPSYRAPGPAVTCTSSKRFRSWKNITQTNSQPPSSVSMSTLWPSSSVRSERASPSTESPSVARLDLRSCPPSPGKTSAVDVLRVEMHKPSPCRIVTPASLLTQAMFRSQQGYTQHPAVKAKCYPRLNRVVDRSRGIPLRMPCCLSEACPAPVVCPLHRYQMPVVPVLAEMKRRGESLARLKASRVANQKSKKPK